jgi:hypothetical protein
MDALRALGIAGAERKRGSLAQRAHEGSFTNTLIDSERNLVGAECGHQCGVC